MDILITADEQMANPFIRLLAEALRLEPDVTRVVASAAQFWEAPTPLDVLLLQWPEALLNWQPPATDRIDRLAAQLDRWRQAARCVIIQVHNSRPHRTAAQDDRLFATVYRAADAFVHSAPPSRVSLVEYLPEAADKPFAYIPLLLNDVYGTRLPNARDALRIPAHDVVMLSLGALRHVDDLSLLVTGFRRLTQPGKRLLIVGSRLRQTPDTLLNLRHRIGAHLTPGITLTWRHAAPRRVQQYLSAADMLIISKRRVLNSSNLPLGFHFGLVVVGPDDGSVGYVLRETGNPVYTPGDHDSFTRALAAAIALRSTDLGARNMAQAAQWQPRVLARHYVAFFREMLGAGGGRR